MIMPADSCTVMSLARIASSTSLWSCRRMLTMSWMSFAHALLKRRPFEAWRPGGLHGPQLLL